MQESRAISQGDAAVNFDTRRILQRHRLVSLPQHGFLAGLYLQTADIAGLLSKVSEEVATKIAKDVVDDSSTVVCRPLLRNPREFPHVLYISRNENQ